MAARYDDTCAKREGWALFLLDDGTLAIQRLDDPQACFADMPAAPVFLSDTDAIEHVRGRAEAGSAMHTATLKLHGTREDLSNG